MLKLILYCLKKSLEYFTETVAGSAVKQQRKFQCSTDYCKFTKQFIAGWDYLNLAPVTLKR